MARIGVDVGGTNTDLVLECDKGTFFHKVPSTPSDQSIATVEGIEQICKIAGIDKKDIEVICHGTTVATNITIEHNGAEVGFITSKGFRDILHIGRHKRPHNFSLHFDVPWQSHPLAKRRNRFAVTERIRPPSGEVEVPLNEDEVRTACATFRKRGINSVAIGFMFSFLNDSHEKRARDIVLEEMPDAYISISSEVANVIREYERFSTVAMNAFVGPQSSMYLRNLEAKVKGAGIPAKLRVIQSNGGISTIEGCAKKPVGILMSGPAGGVIGALSEARLAGTENILTVDIGGTSADISTIADGQFRIKNPRDTVVSGHAVMAPMIDLETIGAGGGSIAFLDAAGGFNVGPRSAGSEPGPACYNRGGTQPTVTDAQVVLGRMDADKFLGGDLPLDPKLSHKAIKEHIADPLGISVIDAALGIIKIVNNNMSLTIRSNSVARGYDPRDFSLMPFGGAGPLHGTALAELVAARDVLVPLAPGITAAMGLLGTDLQYEHTRSVITNLFTADQAAIDKVNAVAEELKAMGKELLDSDDIEDADQAFEVIAEIRYHGQGFELRIPMPEGGLTPDNKAAVIDDFHKQHKADYGYSFDDSLVELYTVRVIATADVRHLELDPVFKGGADDVKTAFMYERETVFDDGTAHTTPRLDRGKLGAGTKVQGPAIIIQHNSTTLLPPGYTAEVLEFGSMRLQHTADGNLKADGSLKEDRSMAKEGKTIDPITLQVIRGAIETIAEEMAHVLFRMSFSSIIRESEDLGAGLFDTEFNTLCESESTPMHIGSIPGYLAGIQDTLDDGEWYENDVVVHNHPYHGASHTPDLAIVIPIFYKGELVGYSGNTAHHIDIGAATPGLIIDVPDVYAEGMLFAGTKLYRKGERNDTMWNFIHNNSRAARQLVDDIEAQIASARLGVKRFKELLDRYGKELVFNACNQLMDYSEKMLRQRIADIPDGEYRAEAWLDDDGRNRGQHLPVKVCVRVIGDRIEVDLTGSAPQTPTAYNVPFEGSTKVAAFAAFRKLLLDTATSETKVPSNQGSFRPIKVIAPKGSIFNPKSPTSAEARFTQCNMMIDLIMKAMAPVLPDKIIAGSSASISFASYAGVRPNGEYWVFLEVNEGAYGGRPNSDGPDSIDNLMANTRNNPLEDLAMHIPMICERYELRDDVQPGAGKYRGGIGVVKSQRILTDGIITHESERHTNVPWGIFGGKEGAAGKCEIYNVSSNEPGREMHSKFHGLEVKKDDVMAYYSPCGGGFGSPFERDPQKVLDDVLDGFCSAEQALDVYGVVLDLEAETVDQIATSIRRDAYIE